MTEFKVGDWVEHKENCLIRHKLTAVGPTHGTSGFHEFPLKEYKKSSISDTPPPQKTIAEEAQESAKEFHDIQNKHVKPVKGGHMAGYGVDVPRVIRRYDEQAGEFIVYSDGKKFHRPLGSFHKWENYDSVPLPHEQEDLKHLFD